MPSPFPGMDPFIEGQDWEDFHQGCIGELSALLVPRVRPRYVVRKERRIYVEHPVRVDFHPEATRELEASAHAKRRPGYWRAR